MTTVTYQSKLPQLTRDLAAGAVKAVNRTAEEAQARMRLQLHLDFTIRSSQSARFLESLIKVKRATPSDPVASVAIGNIDQTGKSGGLTFRRNTAALLSRHEEGGEFHRAADAFPFFIPTQAIGGDGPDGSTGRGIIPRYWYPSALGLAPRMTIAHGVREGGMKGKRGTFVIPGKGIFRRLSSRPGDIEMIWAFTTHIRLKPTLKFRETVARVVQERLPVNMDGVISASLQAPALTAAQELDMIQRDLTGLVNAVARDRYLLAGGR